MTSGYTLTCIVGLGLLASDYNPALGLKNAANKLAYDADVKDEFWRFILFVPVIVNCIMLTVFFLFIRTNSIMFNLSKKDEEHDGEALKLIDRVYDSSEDRQEILAVLKGQVKEKPKSNAPYCESLFGKKNRTTTIYMMVFTSLIQMSTINVLNMYCNRIFTVINADTPAGQKVLANSATQVFGLAGFLAVGGLLPDYQKPAEDHDSRGSAWRGAARPTSSPRCRTVRGSAAPAGCRPHPQPKPPSVIDRLRTHACQPPAD